MSQITSPASRNLLADTLFLKAVRGEATSRPPVWLMRQAGRYQKSYRAIREKVDFLTLCRESELACQVTVDAVDQLGVDAAIIFADILLPLDAMGAGLSFAKGDGPVLERPVRSAADVAALNAYDCDEKLSYVFRSVELFTRARPQIPLIGFAGAPFTLASYLIEGGSSRNFEKTKQFMYREPEAFERLMSFLTDATISYLAGQKKAGAHALMLFDSWVGALSRGDYSRHVLPHSKKIFSALEEEHSLYFGTGCGGMLDLMAESGAALIGVDWRQDMRAARQMIGAGRVKNKSVMGNLDPCVLFADRDEIERQAGEILASMRGESGYVFNLGHGILQHTPEDNVRHLVDFVKRSES